MADALLRKKMSNIALSGAQVVAVANAGCMMQLRLGVRQYGPEVEVVHIVDLLDRAYGADFVGQALPPAKPAAASAELAGGRN
jgi:glycolate oxidase iron-sulfur subunit